MAERRGGRLLMEALCDRRAIVLEIWSIRPGAYQLKLKITTADGSSLTRPLTVIEGPLAER